MREYSGQAKLFLSAALVLVAAQPAQAASTQITSVRVETNAQGIELKLETVGEQQETPQIFTLNEGNKLVTDLLNTQLSSGNFRRDNPYPGITSVEVSALDANSVRVVVSGEASPPAIQVPTPENQQITLSFAPTQAQGNGAETSVAQTPTPLPRPNLPTLDGTTPTVPIPMPGVGTPAPQTNPPAPGAATAGTAPGLPPSVLVPNPRVTIDGVPAPNAGIMQPTAPAPPFLPRAVAPPVGDIAVSNINASPELIDLGTAAIVPRVVLRDAPVREVLALLARSANLNLIFTETPPTAAPGAAPTPGLPPGAERAISLDLENEPVQEVFNYVLQVSGLEANRQGRTIFVGPTLPQAARNIISRTLRLNQVPVESAANFLTAQGAVTQLPIEEVTIQTVGEGAAARTIETRTPTILALRAEQGEGPLLLTGLSVLADSRLNAITLVGNPRQIQIATSFLSQLDARRRQVAVNLKIIDVNLLNTDNFNASFSFGIADGFFSFDQGAALFNFGGLTPPTNAQAVASPLSPPVTANPFAGATVFQDRNNTISVPNTEPGTVRITPEGQVQTVVARGSREFPNPFINLGDPSIPGITSITPATDNIITETRDPVTGAITPTVTQGTPGTITTALPSAFQFPSRLLGRLQAQIVSGNAKILTDPTLVVQEGQQASVNLSQEVFGGVRRVAQPTQVGQTATFLEEPIIKQAGLIVNLLVDNIDDNGFVTLSVNPTVSAPGATVSTGTGQGNITLLTERTLQSGLIRVRDGQTLILTGIIQDSDRTSVSKVPILGDIPILGALFRSTNRINERNEVIVLVTPRILDDTERSAFGYNYNPGSDARQILQQQGFPVQGR